jgi:hypothetical protein
MDELERRPNSTPAQRSEPVLTALTSWLVVRSIALTQRVGVKAVPIAEMASRRVGNGDSTIAGWRPAPATTRSRPAHAAG